MDVYPGEGEEHLLVAVCIAAGIRATRAVPNRGQGEEDYVEREVIEYSTLNIVIRAFVEMGHRTDEASLPVVEACPYAIG